MVPVATLDHQDVSRPRLYSDDRSRAPALKLCTNWDLAPLLLNLTMAGRALGHNQEADR